MLTLLSGNTSAATVPATLTIPPGSTVATFTANANFVSSSTPVTISASLGTTQTAVLTVTPPAVTLSSLTVSPTTVGIGNPATGTVTLTGAAPSGGAVVSLSSDTPSAATTPANVTVPQGATSTTFAVATKGTAAVTVTLSGNYLGTTSTASLRVAPYVPPNLATVATVTVSSAAPGQGGNAAIDGIVDGSPTPPGDYTKEWSSNGELAGAWIKLTWGSPVTITQVVLYDRPNPIDNTFLPAHYLSATGARYRLRRSLPGNGVGLAVSVAPRTVTWVQFTVNSAQGLNIGLAEIAVTGFSSQLSAVSFNPASVAGGSSSTGTVTLNGPAAAGGSVVALSSNNAAAIIPSSVTVAAGSTFATFTATTIPVSSSTPVTISGTYNGTVTGALTVNPPGVAAVSLNPSSVTGGSPSTGTVTLSGQAPAGGATVMLLSNDPSAVVPASVTVPEGAIGATFTINTAAVTAMTTPTITGTYNGTQGGITYR